MNKTTLRRILYVCAALVLAFEALLTLPDLLAGPKPLTEATEVHFLDVGQGDSALLLSGGEAVLIDAGTQESGEEIVRYLRALGVEELYAAVATHPHADHIGGMAQVVEAFPVEHFYMGPETASTATYGRMLDALEARAIQPTLPQSGETLDFASGASLTFLGPADDVSDEETNNRSLITLFEAGAHSVLFMGDAEAEAERSLLAHHPLLSCEVLKVGHHGSSSSSTPEFLRAVHPTTAVISCGVDNDYGHPSPQTLENLSRAGVSDLRITAERGTVVLPFDPDTASEERAA